MTRGDPSSGGPVWFVVEIPKGSFIKRETHHRPRIEYVSPLPCPFNYGYLPDHPAPDGDPADALLLGPRQPAGARLRCRTWARVRFVDAGHPDTKWVLAPCAPTAAERRRIHRFFTLYAPLRGWLNRLRGERGRTAYGGLEDLPPHAGGS